MGGRCEFVNKAVCSNEADKLFNSGDLNVYPVICHVDFICQLDRPVRKKRLRMDSYA